MDRHVIIIPFHASDPLLIISTTHSVHHNTPVYPHRWCLGILVTLMTVPSSCCSRWLYLRESSKPPWEYFWNQTYVVGKVTMVMKGKVIITDIMMWSDYQVHYKGSYEPVGVPGSWTTSIWQQDIHSLTQLTGSSPLHLIQLGFQFPLDCVCWSWPERVCSEHVTSCTPQ